MEHHDCRPPGGRRPIDGPMGWICPECGDRWEGRPLGPTDPAPSYDFETQEGITPAEWVRVGQPISDQERESLLALLEHEQTSGGEVGGWFAEVAGHVRFAREVGEDEDIEQKVSEALLGLAGKGYVRKIGETVDSVRWPVYTVTPAGFRILES
jgi:hypothetical protein